MNGFISLICSSVIVLAQSRKEPLFQQFQDGKVDAEEMEKIQSEIQPKPTDVWVTRKRWLYFAVFISLYEIIFMSGGIAEAFGPYPYGGFPGFNPLELSGFLIITCSILLAFSKIVFQTNIYDTPLSWMDKTPNESTRNFNKNIYRPDNYAGEKQGLLVGFILFAIGTLIDIVYLKLSLF